MVYKLCFDHMPSLKLTKDFLEITGSDALRFVNGMLSADIKWLQQHAPATSRAFFLNPQGQIICEVTVLILDKERFILGVLSQDYQTLYDELNKYIIADDVNLKKSEEFEQVVLEMFEENILAQPLATFKNLNRNQYSMEKSFQVIEQKDTLFFPKMIIGEKHLEVWKRKNKSSDLFQELLIKEPFTQEQFQELKYQHNQVRWHEEVHPGDRPTEFPLADAFSFDKGCYRGQEAVNMSTFRGKPAHLLVKLEFSQELEPTDFQEADVYLGEAKVGSLRSIFKNQAMALLRRSTAEDYNSKLIIKGKTKDLEVHKFSPIVTTKTFRGER